MNSNHSDSKKRMSITVQGLYKIVVVTMMWIRGHKLQHGVVPPYYIQESIKGLVKELADKHDAEFKASVHSEASYVKIYGKIVSFRNHTGRPSDFDIYLSTFNTWRQCEKYFERRVLRRFLY